MTEFLLRYGDALVKLLSFEWLMARSGRPNGGDVVFFRSLLTSAWLYLLFIGISHGFDPTRTGTFSMHELGTEVGKSISVFGALLAATYLAFYARFSSQWSYLAQLYNDIKAIEVQTASDPKAAPLLAQWKAGFIEDASDLHLATKRTFAPVIRAWGGDLQVQDAFDKFTPGGKARLDKLVAQAEKAFNRNACDHH